MTFKKNASNVICQSTDWLKRLSHVDMIFEDRLHLANCCSKRQQNNSWSLTNLDNRPLSALEITELSSRLFIRL